MSSNAKHEEEFKPLEGQEVFRVQRFGLVIGLIGLAVSIGVGVVAFFDRSEIAALLFISGLFAFLSIPIIISYLVARLYVDAEGIEHRNGLGIYKRINWRDIKAIYALTTHNVIICSEREKIKVEPVYRDADRLELLITQYCPDALSLEAAMTVERPGVQTDANVKVFRRKRFYCVSGILITLAGIGLMVMPLDKTLILYLYFSSIIIWGVLIVLTYVVSRVYLDEEKIVHRNLFGTKKQIYWKEIRYIKGNADDRTAMRIYSDNRKITVSFDFSSFELLHDMVKHRSPKAALKQHEE